MRCPKCNSNVYSHHQKINKSGTEIKRVYACNKCKCVFETIEQIIKTDIKKMLDFEVYYDDGEYCGTSKVYAIDTTRDRFLVVNAHSEFIWVDTKDCTKLY